jgi:Ca2+-binding EF-hand superfamily protein
MKKTLIALTLLTTPALAQQPSMQQMPQMPQMPDLEKVFFEQFDTNKDGVVSKEEFLKPSIDQFEHMDRDKNGSLDQAEVKAFNDEMKQRMQEMQRQMQQMQQQGGARH